MGKVAQNANCERGAVGSSSPGFLEQQLQKQRCCCQELPPCPPGEPWASASNLLRQAACGSMWLPARGTSGVPS